MPLRTAWTAAWMRLSSWSLSRMLAMWLAIVFALSSSVSPICWLVLPLASSEKISTSRSSVPP